PRTRSEILQDSVPVAAGAALQTFDWLPRLASAAADERLSLPGSTAPRLKTSWEEFLGSTPTVSRLGQQQPKRFPSRCRQDVTMKRPVRFQQDRQHQPSQ